MSKRSYRSLALSALGALALLAACGGSSTNNVGSRPPGFYITMSGMAFSPLQLEAPPGATITVINDDPMAHTVTSEAVAGDFTPGGVSGVQFDSGTVSGGATVTFTLPATAPDGTVVPYYCKVHKGTMATPNGTIKVNSSAQPTSPPGGSGGMPGGY